MTIGHTFFISVLSRFKVILLLSGMLLLATDSPAAVKDIQHQSIRVSETEGFYEVTVPASRVILRIPKGKMKQDYQVLRKGTYARYFFFREYGESGHILSGWFETESSYKGPEKAWEDIKAELYQDVSFDKEGDWDLVFYSYDGSPHMRACIVLAGTWIELHFSLRSQDPYSKGRLLSYLREVQLETKPVTESQIDYDFEVGIRPGEYQPTFVAKTALKIYKQPSTDSLEVEGIEIPEGEKIAFNDTIYRTVKPGQVKVLASQSVTGRSYGLIDWLSKDDYYSKGTRKSIDLKAGDTIEYLQDRAEGECFFRIDNEILAIDEYLLNVEVTSQPVTEWWVRAVDDRQNPIGWVLIDKKDVEFIDPWETAE